ncbi:MAG: M48 family metalloprotease [Nitrospira sp.]|nr:M48 family metalloprotease [Nitrospira sp.]
MGCFSHTGVLIVSYAAGPSLSEHDASKKLAIGVLLLALCVLSACSSLHDVGKTTLPNDPEALQRRLHDVGLPLLAAAVDWCPFEQEATYGFFLHDPPRKSDTTSHAATIPLVSYVHPHMPAAFAGLALGDRIIEVNTTNVEAHDAPTIMRLVSRLTAARIQPLQLEVQRGAARRTVTMRALPACKFLLRVIESNFINGVSNGRVIAVTTGAMQTFLRDDELAWILAHEVSHNILNHAQNAQLRVMLNAFLHAAVGPATQNMPQPEARMLEAQADYVGAYLMARAGYDLDAVRRVWERLRQLERAQSKSGYEISRTHPTTAERLAAFQETFKEIQNKRQRGEPLQLQFTPRD